MQANGRPSPSMLYAVKQVELVVRARLDEVLTDSPITALQYTSLTVLERRQPLTAAELARNSFVTTQAMADLVGSLHRLGLVRRDRSESDRRQLLLSLTEAGEELLASFAAPVRELEEQMLAGLTARKIQDLRDHLNQCRSNLSND